MPRTAAAKQTSLTDAVNAARADFAQGEAWRWHPTERVLFAPVEPGAGRVEIVTAAVFARYGRKLDVVAGRVVTPTLHLFGTLAQRGFPGDGRQRWWGIRFEHTRTPKRPPAKAAA